MSCNPQESVWIQRWGTDLFCFDFSVRKISEHLEINSDCVLFFMLRFDRNLESQILSKVREEESFSQALSRAKEQGYRPRSGEKITQKILVVSKILVRNIGLSEKIVNNLARIIERFSSQMASTTQLGFTNHTQNFLPMFFFWNIVQCHVPSWGFSSEKSKWTNENSFKAWTVRIWASQNSQELSQLLVTCLRTQVVCRTLPRVRSKSVDFSKISDQFCRLIKTASATSSEWPNERMRPFRLNFNVYFRFQPKSVLSVPERSKSWTKSACPSTILERSSL